MSSLLLITKSEINSMYALLCLSYGFGYLSELCVKMKKIFEFILCVL